MLNSSKKKKDIVKLVYLMALQPELLDIVIPSFVKVAMVESHKKIAPEQLITLVKKRVQESELINLVIPAFDNLFSHEEIQTLIHFYSSETMKKFSTKGKDSLAPLYVNFVQLIQEELAN